MASFQAKTGWESLRNGENKNYSFNHFVPDLLYRIRKKIAKKFKKLRNRILALFKPKQVRKAQERVKIKIIVPICSFPTCCKEFEKKKSRKIRKIKKHHYNFF